MLKSKLINLTMPIFFVLFALWILTTGIHMGKSEGTFPLMVGSFMLIIALFQLGFDLNRSNHKDKFQGSNIPKVIEAVAMLFIYVFMLDRIGYVIDTSLLAFYVMYSLGYRKYSIAIPLAIAFALAAFVIFKVLLGVTLPMIFFDF